MRKVLAILMLCAALAVMGSVRSYAACGTSTPMWHGFDGWWTCPDAAPVAAYAWQISAPTVTNTGTNKVACEVFDDSVGCFVFSAGSLGDNQVALTYDWLNVGTNGCPVTANGPQRVAIAIQAADGSGFIVSLNGTAGEFGYLAELADRVTGPLGCAGLTAAPTVTSQTATSVSLTFPAPKIFSDCDADSAGWSIAADFNTCPDGIFSATSAPGMIYTTVQRCFDKSNPTASFQWPSPFTGATGPWTSTGVRADAAGSATIPFDFSTLADGSCLYIGAAASIGGVDGSGIASFTSLKKATDLPASPTAENVRVDKAQGKVTIAWETRSETGLAGFKIVAVDKVRGERQLGTFVAAKGAPSSYAMTISQSEIKGAKSFYVVSVLTDGSTLRVPASF